ncbi:hypothetical protein [Paenibacillus harenae]|uniref:hypothetical protein n=1 Tax=Paenibacillus harenae TaxID=306543 RepID=UPI00040CA3EF|nr:hypothetical protein [Paenibacillus harenae]
MNDTTWGHAEHDRNLTMHQHVTLEEMKHYVQGLLAEPERERIDQRLVECEACLALFMTVNGSEEAGAGGGLPDMLQLEQRVVSRLMNEQRLERERKTASEQLIVSHAKASRRGTWLQHPAVQYTIAASVTLMLLGSGTFAAFSQRLEERDLLESRAHHPVANSPITGQAESWSDRMVSQTGSWLDGLQALRFK